MNKRLQNIFFVVLMCGVGVSGRAQDLPLFTQKLTNAFLYNPSVAGNTLGSVTFSHRKYWSGVSDSPHTNFLSCHVPFAYHKLGAGINFYQDDIGVSQTLFASAAFAYHIRFRNDNSISMGAAAEFARYALNTGRIDVVDQNDVLLSNAGSTTQLDFSYGMSYQAKYFTLGGSVNRLRTLLLSEGQSADNTFAGYYAAFLNIKLPLAGERDLLEPVLTYRSLSSESAQIDGGLYYTYKDFLTAGGGYRTGGIMNLTAALRIHHNFLVGYSHEMFSDKVQQKVGATNEFTVRIDFRNHDFYAKQKNAPQISTEALALRRKTLVTYKLKGSAARRSSRYKKKIRKNYIHSPNYRMNASKKLMTKKVAPRYNTKKKPRRKRKG